MAGSASCTMTPSCLSATHGQSGSRLNGTQEELLKGCRAMGCNRCRTRSRASVLGATSVGQVEPKSSPANTA